MSYNHLTETQHSDVFHLKHTISNQKRNNLLFYKKSTGVKIRDTSWVS